MRIRPEIGDGRLKVVVNGKLVPVRKSEVQRWCDEWFWSALELWSNWRTLGCMPFAGGWAEQPAHLVEVIMAVEGAYKEVQRGQ